MKKVVLFILCLFSFSIVNAKEYVIKDTDMTVNLSDKWIVFTRENYTDNNLKKKAGLPDNTDIKEVFEKDGLCVDAIYHEGNVLFEFFVIEEDTEVITNLNNIKDEDINEILIDANKGISENFKVNDYGIYNNGKYKFMRFDYIGNNWRIYYYLTFINDKAYKLYVRYPEKQMSTLVNEKDVIDSVKFNVDESMEEIYYKLLEEEDTIEEYEDDEPLLTKDDIKDILVNTFKDTSRDLIIYGIVVVLITIIVIIIVKVKDKKKFKSQNKDFWE